MRKRDRILQLYANLVKYPLFKIQPSSETIQQTNTGEVILKSAHPVSIHTEEKLFLLTYLLQKSKQQENDLIIKLKQLAEITSLHDYKIILKEIQKIKSINLKLIPNSDLLVSPITSYSLNTQKNLIIITFDPKFLELCSCKYTLKINLDVYLKLNPIGKNVYKYLLANSSRESLKIESIKQRCHINITHYYHIREKLKKIMLFLKDSNIIKDFSFDKDKVNYSFCYKNKEEIFDFELEENENYKVIRL